jgi:general secretion pathway protein D
MVAAAAALSAVALTATAFAQAEPAMDTTPVLAPATAPATQEAATQAATAPATAEVERAPRPARPYDPDAKVTFNFRDASADAVLDYLSDTLGFIIIRDGRIEGRLTMLSRQPIGADEAVDLLNSALKPLNYTTIRTGRALRVLSRERAKKANVPVRFGADPAQIRATDEIITQVIPLGQLDAVKLRQDLLTLFSADADVTTNAASNTLIITDTAANINRIAQIISATDRHMASTADIRIFQLQYASAANAAKLINEIFKQSDAAGGQQNQANRRVFFGPGGFGGAGGQGSGQPETSSRTAGKVTASSDDRTNTLVVSGPKELLPVIERVIKELDSNPAQTSTVFVYALRNGQAARLQDVLNTLFGATTGSRTSTASRTGFGSTAAGGATGRASTGRTGATGGTSPFSGFGSTNANVTRTSALGSAAGAATPQLSAQAQAVAGEMVGQVYVVADTDTNSLIITTAPAHVDKIKQILAELDHPIPQVLIKVLLAEVTHENGSDLGLQASLLNKRASGNGQTVGTDFGLAQEAGGMVVSIVEKDFQATLRALASEGKLDVLSRPYILASDNQLASILVGQEVPFITNTRVTDTGQTINTVQYQDIGIILNVTPHINPDGKVIMDVAPEISSLLKDTTVRISDTVSAPVFAKRSAQTRVAIDNGKTIVIGGLMEDRKDVLIQKVPLLGDLPVLGALFRRTQENKRKTELLIFLTPHVAMDSLALHGMSKEEMDGVKIVPTAVKPGTFKDHMEGMQRGATTLPAEPIYVPVPEPERK